MMSLEQIGLEWFASNVGGWGSHVHHFTGSSDREHTPERNVFRRRSQGDLPSIGFNDVHDGGGDMPDEESESEETGNE
jgi:hypothetical protein